MELNYDLDFTGFEEFLKRKNYPMPKTVQYLFRFPNGYGASVEKGPHTYGSENDEWDLIAVHYAENPDDLTWTPVRNTTPLATDRFIYCNDDRVKEILKLIQEIDPSKVFDETKATEIPICQDCLHYEACLAMDDNFNMCERNMAIGCMVRKSKKDYEIVKKDSQN